MELMDNRTKEDVQRLARGRPAISPLTTAQTPDPLLAKSGFGTSQSKSGSGIASPLTETNYADRTFHTTFTMSSTDGLFVLELRRVKSMNFLDANNKALTLEFKDV